MGDVVVAEISAAFSGSPRTDASQISLGEPNKVYRDLHAAADAAFGSIAAVLKAGATRSQVIDASGVIEDAGFTIIDDLLHGYGGGYLLRRSSAARAVRQGRCRRNLFARARVA